MKKDGIEFIKELSNSKFPLYEFVKDLEKLDAKGLLKGFNKKAMEADLVKIAKTFDEYHSVFISLDEDSNQAYKNGTKDHSDADCKMHFGQTSEACYLRGRGDGWFRLMEYIEQLKGDLM